MIVLNSKAQLTVDVIAKVAERKITIANATKLLNKSRRTGIESLKRQETPDLHHKNRTDRAIEEVVIEFSLANPHMGQSKISRLLKSERNIDIHASGVRNIWLRENMNTTELRLAKLAEARQH
ncbi:helix-turn-helix domain-containing protein [Shewanella algae]|uniref:helix-turn-helix domain-containing protein n=1 Tax=Shewanella algae TaxID=38313 RepID=UPI001F32C216|nr:helix-turn-helix domain-containing protein [Shewanella algae]MCE9785217.1 hypothetical protein [Shewanella algae]